MTKSAGVFRQGPTVQTALELKPEMRKRNSSWEDLGQVWGRQKEHQVQRSWVGNERQSKEGCSKQVSK